MLSLVSGEAAQIGILCLLGIFSGAFRSLGRMASVTACAAAAFGVGIVYSPAILFQTMESVLAVGVVFLLLPEKLTCPQKQNLLKEDCGFNEQRKHTSMAGCGRRYGRRRIAGIGADLFAAFFYVSRRRCSKGSI